MRLKTVNVDRYVWKPNLFLNPQPVAMLENATLKVIGFQINPLYEQTKETAESRLHLRFDLKAYPLSRGDNREPVARLKDVLDPDFQPTVEWVLTNLEDPTYGSYRIPLNLPVCNFSEHAVKLMKQVIQAWAIKWEPQGLNVSRQTMVRVRRGAFGWVSFGEYLEMKEAGEI